MLMNTNRVDSWLEVVVTKGTGVYNIVLRLCVGNQWNGSTVVKNLTKVS